MKKKRAVAAACVACLALFASPLAAERSYTLLLERVGAMAAAQSAQPDPKGALITGRSTIVDASDVIADRRSFTSGSRSYWHSHPGGQLILIQAGRARFQERGKPVRELRAGESVFTPPNVPHWHGATPTEAMTQLTIGFPGATRWMEPVTDQEYSAPTSR